MDNSMDNSMDVATDTAINISTDIATEVFTEVTTEVFTKVTTEVNESNCLEINKEESKEESKEEILNIATDSGLAADISRENEINSIVNVKEKKWNTHMLRVCTKYLTQLQRKDFKMARQRALLHGLDEEKEVMQNMLVKKALTLNEEEWMQFHKKLLEFESIRMLHPRKKYGIY
jgi:hypothetical protein